jgi:hypothetical protein
MDTHTFHEFISLSIYHDASDCLLSVAFKCRSRRAIRSVFCTA